MTTGPAAGNQDGFTLVEVLIAMMVFAVGVFAVAALIQNSMRHNTDSATMTEATALARDKMEVFLDQDYDSNELVDNTHDGVAGLSNASPATADGHDANGRFDVLWNIAEDSPDTDSKTIQVIVAWQSHGRARSVTFSSIKAR